MDVGGAFAWLRTPVAVFRNPDLRRVQLALGRDVVRDARAPATVRDRPRRLRSGCSAVRRRSASWRSSGCFRARWRHRSPAFLGTRTHAGWCAIVSAGATALVLGVSAAAAGADGAPAVVFVAAAAFALVTRHTSRCRRHSCRCCPGRPRELSAANVVLSAMDNGGFVAGALGSGICSRNLGA